MVWPALTLAAPAPARIVVVPVGPERGVVLGAWHGGKWIGWRAAQKLHRPQHTRYTLCGRNRYFGQVLGGKMALSPFTSRSLELTFPKGVGQTHLAVSALPRSGCKPFPSTIVAQKHHKRAIRELLKAAGMGRKVPITVRSVWRVDLDGDGRTEDLIAAIHPRRLKKLGIKPLAGDFAITAVVNGGKTTVLSRYVVSAVRKSTTPPEVHSLTQIVDLDGDGKLEIIIGTRDYEGMGYEIFSYHRGPIRRVLSMHDGL